jgi:hypothetical protein
MQTQERAYKAVDVIRFLHILLRKIPGRLLVIWDGSPIHRADVIKQFLASPSSQTRPLGTLTRLCAGTQSTRRSLEFAQTSRTESNLCCQNLAHLRRELILAKERLRHRQTILQHCFAHALAEV